MLVVRTIPLLCLAVAGGAQAGGLLEARLVKDLNTTPTAAASGLLQNPPIAIRDDTLYFIAAGDVAGAAAISGLVRSDGTEAGTQWLPRGAYDGNDVREVDAFDGGVLFASIDPATPSSGAMYHVDAGFTQTRPIAGPETRGGLTGGDDAVQTYLCSDGTGVGEAVCAVRAGQPTGTTVAATAGSGMYVPVGAIGGATLFFYRDALWRSDGTAPGTVPLANLLSMQDWSVPFPPRWPVRSIVADGRRYFQACAQPAAAACGIYATDGIAAPTLLASIPKFIYTYVQYRDGIAFTATDELWTSEGTPQTTRHIVTTPYYPFSITSAGGLLHLLGWQASPDTEYRYYVSDATAAGTREVPLPTGVRVDGVPLADYEVRAIGEYDDRVLFPCSASGYGQEVCVADGDGSGVTAIIDIQPGAGSSGAYPLARTSDAIYFRANDGIHGYELWRVAQPADALFADGFE